MSETKTLKQSVERTLKSYTRLTKQDPEYRQKLLTSELFERHVKSWKLYRSNKTIMVFKVDHPFYGDIFYENAHDVVFDFEQELDNLSFEGEQLSFDVEIVAMTGKALGELPVFEY